MTGRFLIGHPEIINQVIATQFTLLKADNNKWQKLYEDKDQIKWLSMYPNSGYHGGGEQIVVKLPMPSIQILIDIALSSPFSDEVDAACLLLLSYEKDGQEFRLALVEKLEINDNSDRVKQIIVSTNLESNLNRRDTLGKSLFEVNTDAAYFDVISKRAKELRQNL